MRLPPNKTAAVINKERAIMTEIESTVRRYALLRLAAVFKVDVVALSPTVQFGRDIQARPASDFKLNEFDLIDRDIKDVADKVLLRAMSCGELEIRTVGDYCDHMVRCHVTRPNDVARLLSLPLVS
jgi:hypothetical protein